MATIRIDVIFPGSDECDTEGPYRNRRNSNIRRIALLLLVNGCETGEVRNRVTDLGALTNVPRVLTRQHINNASTVWE